MKQEYIDAMQALGVPEKIVGRLVNEEPLITDEEQYLRWLHLRLGKRLAQYWGGRSKSPEKAAKARLNGVFGGGVRKTERKPTKTVFWVIADGFPPQEASAREALVRVDMPGVRITKAKSAEDAVFGYNWDKERLTKWVEEH